MPIRVLGEKTISQIAAGEVVSRPASVVKELVENSIDACASRIDIEVTEGGMKSIRVTDNGHGIPRSEIETAFKRFATSKIDDASNLYSIGTLGFRGEALPSIASVGEVRASSRAASEDAGTTCILAQGEVISVQPAAVPNGTTLLVNKLFHEVPARLKFMRSAGTELSKITQVISAYALSYPYIAFRLIADASDRLVSQGNGSLVDAATAVYSPSIANAMIKLDSGSDQSFRVEGLIGEPGVSRGNRNYITLAVNGRWIYNRRLSYAVEQAYSGFLETRRFPIAILRISVPLADVDVNVHPAKSEVQFVREDLVFNMVQRSVRATLLTTSPVPALQRATISGSTRPGTERNVRWHDGILDEPLWPTSKLASGSEDSKENAVRVSTTGTDLLSKTTPLDTLPLLRVIGQSQETYIVAEGPIGFYLIDQHAAHERVLHDRYRSRTRNQSVETQNMLEPELLELEPIHMALIEANAESLKSTGFSIESFGPSTVIIRGVPSELAQQGSGSVGHALRRLLDAVSEGGTPDAWQERMLKTLACHTDVRAGRRLTDDDS